MTDARYGDFVTPPEYRRAAGRDWYIRALHDSRGAVVAVKKAVGEQIYNELHK